MGEKVWWFEDCPKCKGKGTVENFEQLSSNMKFESCEKCDYRVDWVVDDSKDIVEIYKEGEKTPPLIKERLQTMSKNEDWVYKLKQPMLGWAKGELFTFNADWNEWTRKKTGETFDYRKDVGSGEKAILLNMLVNAALITILEKVK